MTRSRGLWLYKRPQCDINSLLHDSLKISFSVAMKQQTVNPAVHTTADVKQSTQKQSFITNEKYKYIFIFILTL